MGLFDASDDSPIENADIDCQPQNDYVTKEKVKEIDEYLNPGEKVHYMANDGGGGMEIQGASGKELTNIVSAATDKRLVVASTISIGESGQQSFFYKKISGVGLKTALIQKKISIQTNSETYRVGVGNLDKEEAKEMTGFIRKKSNEMERGAESSNSSESPMEKIKKLNELKEAGAISEEEFERKKSDLMDQI